MPLSAACRKSALDLLVCLVLAQSIDGPDCSRYPSDDGDLEQQADDSCERAANREELQPRQNQGEQKAHFRILVRLIYFVIFSYLPSLASEQLLIRAFAQTETTSLHSFVVSVPFRFTESV